MHHASVPATNKPSGQKSSGEPTSEPGQQEYLQAQEILKGKDREDGLSEAVRLLWIAVEKGNSAAEVSLAGLYRLGEGVTRNCDQTQNSIDCRCAQGQRRRTTASGRILTRGLRIEMDVGCPFDAGGEFRLRKQ